MQSLPSLQDPGLYLERMQALVRELEAAMTAIASNSLAVLEKSVAKQEMLCAELFILRSTSLAADASPQVALQLQQGASALSQMTLAYEALLTRSVKSAALLSALCSSRTGTVLKQGEVGWKQQTWSCEG